MSKRAKEAALKAYPEEITTAYGPLPGASGPCEFDDNQPYRTGFIKGYEQAEKDMKERFIHFVHSHYPINYTGWIQDFQKKMEDGK